jgi:hypothetical protein
VLDVSHESLTSFRAEISIVSGGALDVNGMEVAMSNSFGFGGKVVDGGADIAVFRVCRFLLYLA